MASQADPKRSPVALTIAGSDSGAGAGIQADLKTMAAHGVYGCSVLTMVTAQSTQAVDAVEILSPALVRQQLSTVFTDFTVGAVKTGALGSAEVISVVAAFLRQHAAENLVIDPVMISKHGHQLLDPDAVAVLLRDLLPLARVVTPNLSEAAVMAEMPEISDRNAMLDAAERIAAPGCASVVIKGGHSTAEPVDLLWTEGTATWLTGERIATSNTHGTGCTFSAAITANLLRGLELVDAVTAAKRYITGAIEHGQVFGRGFNPVNHFWQTNPRFGAGK